MDPKKLFCKQETFLFSSVSPQKPYIPKMDLIQEADLLNLYHFQMAQYTNMTEIWFVEDIV